MVARLAPLVDRRGIAFGSASRMGVSAARTEARTAHNRPATLPRRGGNSIRRQHEIMTTSPDGSLHKHIRVSPAQWERIERAAEGSPHSPNQILVELAMEALDRREWPGTETEIKVARASLFAAQALARGLIADGRENEVREIREFISTIVPDPEARPDTDAHRRPPVNQPSGDAR